jgi:superfamily II DNA or RNA helicase
LTYKEAVANSYIVPVEAFSIGVTKKENDCYSWSQVYSQLVVHNDARNKLIGALLERLDSLALPTLCLIKEIAHGSLLSGLTGIPFANGQDDESRDYIRQFNNGGIKALIGTVGVLGEGIDTRPAEYIIIAGLGKAKSAFMQNVGRGLRKYPGKDSAKVIIFKDSSHKFTLRHYKAQEKILLDEFGITPVKLDIE